MFTHQIGKKSRSSSLKSSSSLSSSQRTLQSDEKGSIALGSSTYSQEPTQSEHGSLIEKNDEFDLENLSDSTKKLKSKLEFLLENFSNPIINPDYESKKELSHHKFQAKVLKQKVETLKVENKLNKDRLFKKLEEKDKKIIQLEDGLSFLSEQEKLLIEKLKEREVEVTKLKDASYQSKNALVIDQLRNELIELKDKHFAEITKNNNENQQLNFKLQQAQGIIDTLYIKNEALLNDLNEKDIKIIELNKNVEILKQQPTPKSDAVSSPAFDGLVRDFSDLVVQNQKLSDKNILLANKNLQLQNSNRNLHLVSEKNLLLQNELKCAKSNAEKLERTLLTIDIQTKEWAEAFQNKDGFDSVYTMYDQIRQLKQKLQEMTAKYDEATEMFNSHVSSQTNESAMAIENARKENSRLQKELSDVKSQLIQDNSDKTILMKQKGLLEREISILNEQLEFYLSQDFEISDGYKRANMEWWHQLKVQNELYKAFYDELLNQK